jgi:hypothetical protein
VQSHGLIVILINSIGTSVVLTEDLCDVLRHHNYCNHMA